VGVDAATCRVVALRHEHIQEPHFDLMVEPSPGSLLLTWRLPVWPPEVDPILVARLRDHRNQYLTYEGPIFGGRGQVHSVYQGRCRAQIDDRQVQLTDFTPPLPFSELRLTRETAESWSLFINTPNQPHAQD
jgi:hypothetical protein